MYFLTPSWAHNPRLNCLLFFVHFAAQCTSLLRAILPKAARQSFAFCDHLTLPRFRRIAAFARFIQPKPLSYCGGSTLRTWRQARRRSPRNLLPPHAWEQHTQAPRKGEVSAVTSLSCSFTWSRRTGVLRQQQGDVIILLAGSHVISQQYRRNWTLNHTYPWCRDDCLASNRNGCRVGWDAQQENHFHQKERFPRMVRMGGFSKMRNR